MHHTLGTWAGPAWRVTHAEVARLDLSLVQRQPLRLRPCCRASSPLTRPVALSETAPPVRGRTLYRDLELRKQKKYRSASGIGLPI